MKTLLMALVMVVPIEATGIVGTQDFEKATRAYDAGAYINAARILKVLADQGDAEAQHKLGVAYEKGQGVAQDYKEAVKWYRLSAEQGVAEAQHKLGAMYMLGQGVGKDVELAAKWHCKAAKRGAKSHIAQCLKLAGRGSAETQFRLGKLFQQGQGVAQDEGMAARWICGAAEMGFSAAIQSCHTMASLGNATAQYRLGLLLGTGKGVLQDLGSAHMWLNIAAANGASDGFRQMDKLARKLTAEELENTPVRTRRCMESNYSDCGVKAKPWWKKAIERLFR